MNINRYEYRNDDAYMERTLYRYAQNITMFLDYEAYNNEHHKINCYSESKETEYS